MGNTKSSSAKFNMPAFRVDVLYKSDLASGSEGKAKGSLLISRRYIYPDAALHGQCRNVSGVSLVYFYRSKRAFGTKSIQPSHEKWTNRRACGATRLHLWAMIHRTEHTRYVGASDPLHPLEGSRSLDPVNRT